MGESDVFIDELGEVMRRAALGYLEGGERVPGGGASTSQAVATASPTIPEMYEEWLVIRNRDLADMSDEEVDVGYQQYASLQALIIAAEPQTPRDVAIQFLVDTDDTDSHVSDEFESRVRELAAGRTSDDAAPPVETIEALFRRWKDAEAREDAAENDEDADLVHEEYNALQEQLTKETPKTARELAMILIAATDCSAAPFDGNLEYLIDTLADERDSEFNQN